MFSILQLGLKSEEAGEGERLFAFPPMFFFVRYVLLCNSGL